MTGTAGGGPIGGSDDARLVYLRRLGFDSLEHDSHVPFLSHLVGTARLLRRWGSDGHLCDAGLFHSVYGTEYFEPSDSADPAEVRELIGPQAERVAWLWCTIRRDTLDPDARTAIDRRSGDVLSMTGVELGDVATLWAADTVEQIERMTAEERSFAGGLQRVVHAASAPAQDAVAALGDALPEGA